MKKGVLYLFLLLVIIFTGFVYAGSPQQFMDECKDTGCFIYSGNYPEEAVIPDTCGGSPNNITYIISTTPCAKTISCVENSVVTVVKSDVFSFPHSECYDAVKDKCVYTTNCASDEYCNNVTFTCVKTCIPNCTNKNCGDDGCRGTCGTNNGTCRYGTCNVTSGNCLCYAKNCSQLGKVCGIWPDGCGTNLTCGSCDLGYACGNGQCIKIGNLYWINMKGNIISSANVFDTVKLVVNISGIQDKRISYNITKTGGGVIWSNIRTALFPEIDYNLWKISESGLLFFTSRIEGNVQDLISTSLDVSEEEDNSKPQIQIIKPANETNFIIQNGKTSTENISLEQISSDEDDDLNITWIFGDNKIQRFSNCLTGINCNTTYSYNSSGTKIIQVIANEMTRKQRAIDRSRIYVFKEGLNIFAIIDSPVYKEVLTEPGAKMIDGRSSYVANCSFDKAKCISSGASCYSVNDSINPAINLWCYKLAESDKLGFTWVIDSGTSSQEIIDTNNQPFFKIFIEPKEHIIKLVVKYVY